MTRAGDERRPASSVEQLEAKPQVLQVQHGKFGYDEFAHMKVVR